MSELVPEPEYPYEVELDALRIEDDPRLAHRFVGFLPFGYVRRQLDRERQQYTGLEEDPLLTMYLQDIDEAVAAEGVDLDEIRYFQERVKKSEGMYEALVMAALPVIKRLRRIGYKLIELQDWDTRSREHEKAMTSDEIVTKVKKLKLPKGKFVVYGSAPLAVAGIRDAGDVDLLVAPGLWTDLRAKGWIQMTKSEDDMPIIHDVFEAHDSWDFSPYSPSLKKLLSTATYVDGVPFASLDEVRKWKEASGGAKHVRDVRLIDEYLNGAIEK